MTNGKKNHFERIERVKIKRVDNRIKAKTERKENLHLK